MSKGTLYVCATPIGNLEDVSDRLRRVLGEVDVVFAEDTRRTATLLAHVGASPRLRSLFVGNEKERTEELLGVVAEGKRVALVSDAGSPTISDPGADAVRMVRQAGYDVVVIPGPSAVTTALTAAGFGGDRFAFEGFLPRKGKERDERLGAIAGEERPVVVFVSPNRLTADLGALGSVVGLEREIAITRELTKLHEEVWVGRVGEAIEEWSDRGAKGEFTIVIGPGEHRRVSLEDAIAEARRLVAEGTPPSAAAREVAEAAGLSRRSIYQALIGDPHSLN